MTQRHSGITDEEVAALRNFVTELVIFPAPLEPKQGIIGKVGRFSQAVIKATPPNVLHRYSREIQTWIDSFVQAGKCDVIDCEHSVNELYIRPDYRHKVGTVVDVHSSIYGWVRNHLDMGVSQNPVRDRLYLNLLLERYEKRYCSKFTTIVVTTDDDRKQLQNISPESKFEIVSNGVDLEMFPYRPKDPGGHDLIFVGAMNSTHNIDAARFFAIDVFPHIQKRYPDATFTIVGANPTPEILALKELAGITVTGRVPSVVEYTHKATVCVVPLRVGLGIKTKTLETMSAGTPIVASDRGLEGLTVDGESVSLRALRANKVEEYVEETARLFENPQLRQELSRNGRSLVETEYTWERIGQRYEQVLLESQV